MPSGAVYCKNFVRVSIMNPNFKVYNPTIKTCSRVQSVIGNLLGSNFTKQMHMQEPQLGSAIGLPIISCMFWLIQTQLILAPRDLAISLLKSDIKCMLTPLQFSSLEKENRLVESDPRCDPR